MLFHEDLIAPLGEIPAHDTLATVAQNALLQAQIDVRELGGYNIYSDLSPPHEAIEFVSNVAQLLNGRATEHVSEHASTAPRGPGGCDFHALSPPVERSGPSRRKPRTSDRRRKLGAAVIAAGDYVRTQVIPALRSSGVALRVVADFEPHVAEYARTRFRFDAAETDWRSALEHPATDIVVVATYHDSHAVIAAEALRQRKRVILEKPPAVTAADLDLLIGAASKPDGFLEIGYNRRYAPFSRIAKRLWLQEDGPTTISAIVKEVEIPPTHWYRWPKEGTRVTGNLCHWIDFAVFILGADRIPCELTVSPAAGPEPDEERTFTIAFDDGSVATILATQRGDPTLGVQETIDIRRGSLSIQIDDFRRFVATRSGRMLYRRRRLRDKGHRTMYAEMLRRIQTGELPQYTLADLRRTTELTILATHMVRTGDRHRTLEADYSLALGSERPKIPAPKPDTAAR